LRSIDDEEIKQGSCQNGGGITLHG